MRFRSAALAVVVCCGLSLSVSAAPPSDADIDAAIGAFNTKMQEAIAKGDRSAAAQGKAAAEALGSLALAEASIDQIDKLNSARVLQAAGSSDTLRTTLAARLAELAKDQGPVGARAAALGLYVLPRPTPGNDAALTAARDALLAALKHPGMPEALAAGKGADVFRFAGMLPPSTFAGSDLAGSAQRLLSGELPPTVVLGAVEFFNIAADETSKTPLPEREKLRVALLGALDSASARADDRAKPRIERARSFLNGAYARGSLVDGPAPELDFTWTNFPKDNAPAKLSDLKGRVVVIDFWATWCGPCVASFPQVRDLAARYKDYPVTILGVTSLQGYSIKWKDGRPAGREENLAPDREHQLMTEFVEQMDMTWPVVFAKQEVFNPDYGVRGIPHVVIIDPKGNVRHRGLHPAAEPEKKHEMIDALLKEAGLPFPGGPTKPAGQG